MMSFRALERFVENLPEPDYKDMIDFMNVSAPELRILDLRYRKSDPRPTREQVAEECGMSVSTLDRTITAFFKRLARSFKRASELLKLRGTSHA